MNFLLDISHPAYAHAFHYFILEMKKRGHSFQIISRDKDVTQHLLNKWGIEYISKGKGSTRLFFRITHAIKTIWKLYYIAKRYNPDLLMSFASFHISAAGWLLRKPVITFEDTENFKMLHRVNRLFSSKMITPESYKDSFGKNHIRFPSYKELAHLHPNHFTPDASKQPPKPYILIRFVSWQAWHDRGHSGISIHMKEKIIDKLSEYGTLYISSEAELPEKWKKYKIPVPPEHIHSLMAGATLVFGESASMAAEAAVLGIPSIYIDNTGRGYTDELEDKYDLLYCFGESDTQVSTALTKAARLLSQPDLLELWQLKRGRMLEEKVDLCEWMVGFVGEEGL